MAAHAVDGGLFTFDPDVISLRAHGMEDSGQNKKECGKVPQGTDRKSKRQAGFQDAEINRK
jgi:hypothetical protein